MQSVNFAQYVSFKNAWLKQDVSIGLIPDQI